MTTSSNKNKSMPEHPEAEDYDDFCLPSTTCSSDHHEHGIKPPPRRKKRSSTKSIKMSNEASTSFKSPKHNISVGSRKGKAAMVGDSSVPMTTNTCTECGKKFWSSKALHGHMRCHPERPWRGINPPPHFRNNKNNNGNIINKPFPVMIMVNPTLELSPRHQKDEYEYGEEDKEVASCLLMLANSTNATCTSATNTNVGAAGVASDTAAIRPVTLLPLMVQQQQQQQVGLQQQDRDCLGETVGWFKSSRCKVIGSHQALGGDRAGHKNVNGCFGINRSTCCSDHDIMDHNDDVDRAHYHHPPPSEHHIIDHDQDPQDIMAINSRTNLNNYQALGGHKRCNLEKVPDHHQVMDTFFFTTAATRHYHHHVRGALDLNFPAPAAQSTPQHQHQHQQLELQQHDSLYSPDQHPAGLTLNLRLGL